jgi:uncharacterized protein (DUF927 family)
MQINVVVSKALLLGWSIIPVSADKKSKLKSWKEFQTRPATEEQVKTWRRDKPAGFAVVAGAVSQLVIFDFDGCEGLATMRRFGIKPHLRTGSGGGHWYVEHPGYRISTVNGKSDKELNRLFPGVDVRADGGYAIFVGRNQQGEYEWLREMVPDKWEGPFIEAISPMIRKKGSAPPPAAAATSRAEELAERLLRDAFEKARNGGRNSSGFWLACQLRDNAFSENEAVARLIRYSALVPETNSKGQTERYTQAEALASVRQAYRAAAREPWKTSGNGRTASDAPPPTSGPVSDPLGAAAVEDNSPEQKKTKHFLQTSQGVFYVDEESESRLFICSPMRVQAYTRDADGESWGRLLTWTDRSGRQHQWSMPMLMTAGDGTALRENLLNGGLTIGTGAKPRQYLLEYIQNERPRHSAVCVPHVGWHDRTFVFPECSIPEDREEQVIYQTAAARGEHFYNTAGTFENWRDFIGRLCVGNSRLVFAVSAAFAGPLLRPLSVEGGGFHITGSTSSGKSTVQEVAGSVCGGRGARGYARSWRSTGNALEATAELHNDGLLVLDEIREVSDPKEIDSIVYMLANGTGKGRLTRGMSAQRVMNWQLLLLSSGEVKLSEYAGRQIKGGAEVRLLNVPGDAGADMGVFENIHDAESPRAFAEELKATARTIYGYPLREFIGHLVRDWGSLIAQGKNLMTDFIGTNLPPDAAPEVGRALRRVALVAAAGELATAMGITGWTQGEASRAASRCFQDWIKGRGGVGQADIEAGVRQVRAFIESHGASRFQSVILRLDSHGDRIEERVIDRVGYWKEDENGERQFLVLPEAFQNQVCRGFDHRAIAAELARRNLLVKGDGKNLQKRETLPNEGRLRMYVIRQRILDDEEDDKTAAAGA